MSNGFTEGSDTSMLMLRMPVRTMRLWKPDTAATRPHQEIASLQPAEPGHFTATVGPSGFLEAQANFRPCCFPCHLTHTRQF